MKFTLTIEANSRDEIMKFLAGESVTHHGPSASKTAPQSAPAPAQPDDDNEPVNHAAPEVDSTGLPWDERIHAASKSVTQDGTWRKRRGVSDDVVKSVEAELRAARANVSQGQPVADNQPPAAAPQPQPETPVAAPQGQPVADNPAPPAAPAASNDPSPPAATPQPAPAPETPPAAAPASNGAAMGFGEFMQVISQGIASNTIDQNYISAMVAELQIPAITTLATDAGKLASAIDIMKRDGKIA